MNKSIIDRLLYKYQKYDLTWLRIDYETIEKIASEFSILQQKVNQLEEENRKLINNKCDTIYLIQDLACYDRETNSYCNSIKYYDVHKIIEELEGGSNE